MEILKFIVLIYLLNVVLKSIMVAIGFIVAKRKIDKKFGELYDNAPDERSKRDLYITFRKLDKKIPIDVYRVIFHPIAPFYWEDLLSNDLYNFLYDD